MLLPWLVNGRTPRSPPPGWLDARLQEVRAVGQGSIRAGRISPGILLRKTLNPLQPDVQDARLQEMGGCCSPLRSAGQHWLRFAEERNVAWILPSAS